MVENTVVYIILYLFIYLKEKFVETSFPCYGMLLRKQMEKCNQIGI